MSYDPATEHLIIPLSQSCMEMSGRKVEFADGSGGTRGDRLFLRNAWHGRQRRPPRRL